MLMQEHKHDEMQECRKVGSQCLFAMRCRSGKTQQLQEIAGSQLRFKMQDAEQ
jgi:hypothetical protein